MAVTSIFFILAFEIIAVRQYSSAYILVRTPREEREVESIRNNDSHTDLIGKKLSSLSANKNSAARPIAYDRNDSYEEANDWKIPNYVRFRNLVSKVDSLEKKMAYVQELVMPRMLSMRQGQGHFTMSELLRAVLTVKSVLKSLTSRVVAIEQRHTNADCERYMGTGVRRIYPTFWDSPSKVYCAAGWTVIQRRYNGSLDFYRKWVDYRNGFGEPDAEYWLGNEKIHRMTMAADYKLRITMATWTGRRYVAEYGLFRLDSEKTGYRLRVERFSGNVFDSLRRQHSSEFNHNGQPFSTFDRKNNDDAVETNCAEKFHGAWWYNDCYSSNLNGRYCSRNETALDCVVWFNFYNKLILRAVTMAIRIAA